MDVTIEETGMEVNGMIEETGMEVNGMIEETGMAVADMTTTDRGVSRMCWSRTPINSRKEFKHAKTV